MFTCPAGPVEDAVDPVDPPELPLPPQPAANDAAAMSAATATINRRFISYLQRSRKDHRPGQMSWPVRIEPARASQRNGRAVYRDELRHRIAAALEHRRSGGANVVG